MDRLKSHRERTVSTIVTTKKPVAPHKWLFPSRIRPNVFTWKSSSTAVTRIREAVAEIQKVSRNDPQAAAEGAVRLIERLSPALEHVDSSSGALGTSVNRAIEALVPIISAATVSIAIREKWLERLYEAHAADQVPYIEILADFWGELCVSQELASTWADQMIGITRMALSPDKNLRGHYHGTSACLSALLRAGRYEDIYSLLAHTDFWHYKCYAVKALAAEGKHNEAITLAESLRGPWTPDGRSIDCASGFCWIPDESKRHISVSGSRHMWKEPTSQRFAPLRRLTRAFRASRSSAISSSGRRAMRASGLPPPRSYGCSTWL